jgi:predicted RNase H-like nuclease (RuvC/YqgF family)
LQWVIQVINLNKELYNEESQIEELNEKLNEALEAFQNQDYILIGDLLNTR